MKKQLLSLLVLGFAALVPAMAAEVLTSPGGQITVTLDTDADGHLTWAVSSGSTPVLLPSRIGAVADGRQLLAGKPRVARRQQVDQTFATPIYRKQQVADRYNMLLLNCGGGNTVEVRAYDDGAAYRIGVGQKRATVINSEEAQFRFAADYPAFIPYVNETRTEDPYSFSFEAYYDEQPLSQMQPGRLAISPLCVCLPGGMKAVVMDGGVEDYPGMMLTRSTEELATLEARFAPYVLEQGVVGRGLNLVASRRADYLARISGRRTLPWRAVVVAQNDAQLLDCDMAMRLSPAQRLADTSWIRPGKVAWDWWNNTNITGVDFISGMNTPTYKHYIDFAAENHLEYIIIDEGWSGRESLTRDLNPDIDLPLLIDYGRQRGVGVILWSSWRNMIGNDAEDGGLNDMEYYMEHYERMGVKGFKIDFFDRDDQQAVRSAWQLAECAARHHLLLDLHGLRSLGLHRAWPNVLNYEGVKGLENAKWEARNDGGPVNDQPRYDVTIPYLRQLAGPMDYTPGAMDNATRDRFFGCYGNPMSQGTRAHQVAMYVVFDAPLQMLADTPSKYRREQPTTSFISQIPTTFDETRALQGELGEYVAVARRKGSTWYVAAMNNWTPRTLTLTLDFLSPGQHQAQIFADGVNAVKDANDHRITRQTLSAAEPLTVTLAPAGGWAAIIE